MQVNLHFRFLVGIGLVNAPSKPPAAGTRGCASPRTDDTSRCFFNNNLRYRRRSAGSMTYPLWAETLPMAPHSTPAQAPGSATRVRIASTPFAQKNFSILLDTHILREQARDEVSPFEARLPLHSPSAVS